MRETNGNHFGFERTTCRGESQFRHKVHTVGGGTAVYSVFNGNVYMLPQNRPIPTPLRKTGTDSQRYCLHAILGNRDSGGRYCSQCCAFDTLILESLLSGIAELHRFFIIADLKRFGNAICEGCDRRSAVQHACERGW